MSLVCNNNEEIRRRQVEMPDIGLSGSEIRRRIIAGESIRYHTPCDVENYIETNKLYRIAIINLHLPWPYPDCWRGARGGNIFGNTLEYIAAGIQDAGRIETVFKRLHHGEGVAFGAPNVAAGKTTLFGIF